MSLGMARAVLTLPVRLIDRRGVDVGSLGTRVLVVRIDVVDLHREPGVGDIGGQR